MTPSRLGELMDAWRTDPSVAPNICAWHTQSAQPAQLAPFPEELNLGLTQTLRTRGISGLYSHQAAAWDQVRAGRHVVIVTGTASGKTLCYNLPVLDTLFKDSQSRALYLFPTKALAQDQVAALANLAPASGPAYTFAATYDGDSRSDQRPTVRALARIIVSNPDMLHTGILPHHTLWAEFFCNLRFVVIDEMHVYRGVFGSHVANVLRRLKRVAQFYGAAPQFILTSATIANPVELAERLIEEQVVLIEQDGAERGIKHFLIYNPPFVNRDLGLRKSSLLESVRLAQDLRDHNVQTILFARARRTVEIILKYMIEGGQRNGDERAPIGQDEGDGEGGHSQSVRGYRSGYLPQRRREIERGLREGLVRTVVATNALELGVDIGGMGAAILVGYPGSIAATRQQAGRAGRHNETAMAVLVALPGPLDQYLAHHPEYLFDRSPEQALINPNNLLILMQHLRCAAFELPFASGESFGRVPYAQMVEFLDLLQEGGLLHKSGDKYFWMADRYPAADVSLRTASADTVMLHSGEATIGQVDLASASWMVHPEAIYLHEGHAFLVQDLTIESSPRIARLVPVEADYYTEPKRETTVRLLELSASAGVAGGVKHRGEIAVTTQVTGFRKVKWFTHENLGEGTVSLPASELHTTGYWLAVNDATVEGLRSRGLWTNDPNEYGPRWGELRARVRERDGFRCRGCGLSEARPGPGHHVHHRIPFRSFASTDQANALDNLVTLCPECHRRAEVAVRLRSGLAGLSHVLFHLAPLFLMCDERDLGGHSDPQSPLANGQPTIVLFDQTPAGIGLTERLYELHNDLLAKAREQVASCECKDGCPSCVGPGGEGGCGGKRETAALLEGLVGPNLQPE